MNRLEPQIHPLLTKEIVDALHGKYVFTVLDFIKTDAQQIVKIARLNFKEVLAIRNFLLKKFSALPVNGFDCYKATLNNTAIIPTGIKGVDEMLKGGLLTGNIYEICGLPSAGKTRFILSIIKNIICRTNQPVYLFDTKNDFSGLALKKLLKNHDEEHQRKYLKRVIVNRIYTKYDLINAIYNIKTKSENNTMLRLIIIDSLANIILSCNDPSANNAYLNHLANVMRYISTEYYTAFLVTNLITTWNDSDFKNQQETVENIACGKYWFTVPNTRLKIEKTQDKYSYRMQIMKSDTFTDQKSVNFQFDDV